MADPIVNVTTRTYNIEVTKKENKVEISAPGPQGIKGDTGQGVPVGGTTGQSLVKIDGTNYNTQWATPAISFTGYDYEIHVSQVDGNDTTGNGDILTPVASITKALTLVDSQRKTVIVHPGTYSESPSITTQYTVLTGPGLVGGNIVISGTVTTNTGCTISGLKMTNLTVTTPTGTGNVNILNCDISGTFTKSGTADYTLIRFCDIGVTNITGSAGLVAIFGGNPSLIKINNAGARVIVKNAVTVAPVLTAGNANFVDSIVVSIPQWVSGTTYALGTLVYNSGNTYVRIVAGAGTTAPASDTTNWSVRTSHTGFDTTYALTSAAGTIVTLANSQFIIPAFNNVARVALSGFYSIFNCVYDKPNSTLIASSETGGTTNSIDYFQYINADKFITQGGTSSQFVKGDGSLDTNTYSTTSHNHNGVYQPVGSYLTSYTETDPIFLASPSYGITSTNITNWNTAYTDRNKWDGGATGLTPATGRTSLGLGTMAVETASNYATLSGATFTGAVNGTSLTLSGDLTVNGTTTTINSTTLSVDDKNIELGSITSPTDTTADGGGITLKGTTDKTFNWVNSTSSWTSSENIDLASGKTLKIAGVDVLSVSNYTGKAETSGNADTVTNGIYKNVPNAFTVGGHTITNASDASGLTITSNTGTQSSALLKLNNVSSNFSGNALDVLGVFFVSSGGRLAVRTTSLTASLNVDAVGTTNVGAKIFGAASQTADLLQFQSSTPTTLGGRNALAQIYSGSNTAVGGSNAATIYSVQINSSTEGQINFVTQTGLATGDFVVVTAASGTSIIPAATYIITNVLNSGTNNLSYITFALVGATITAQTTTASSLPASVTPFAQASFTSRSAGTPALLMRNSSGQIADIMQVRVTTDNTTWGATSGFSNLGSLYVRSGGNFGGSLSVGTNLAYGTGQVIRGVSGQVNDLLQLQNSSTTVITGIGAAGEFYSGITGSTGAAASPAPVSFVTPVAISTTSQTSSSTVTYNTTYNHGLVAGQYVNITGVTSTPTTLVHNISGVVNSVTSSTQFTMIAAATGSNTGTGGTITGTRIQAFIQGTSTYSPALKLRASSSKSVTVTAASGVGGTVTYTAAQSGYNALIVGDTVSITNLTITTGSSLNLSSQTVVTSSATQFTVTNAAVGTAVATQAGTATVAAYASTFLLENAAGSTVMRLDQDGSVRSASFANLTSYTSANLVPLTTGWLLAASTSASTSIPLKIQNANAGTITGDLTQWLNNAGTVLASINSSGNLVLGNTLGTAQGLLIINGYTIGSKISLLTQALASSSSYTHYLPGITGNVVVSDLVNGGYGAVSITGGNSVVLQTTATGNLSMSSGSITASSGTVSGSNLAVTNGSGSIQFTTPNSGTQNLSITNSSSISGNTIYLPTMTGTLALNNGATWNKVTTNNPINIFTTSTVPLTVQANGAVGTYTFLYNAVYITGNGTNQFTITFPGTGSTSLFSSPGYASIRNTAFTEFNGIFYISATTPTTITLTGPSDANYSSGLFTMTNNTMGIISNVSSYSGDLQRWKSYDGTNVLRITDGGNLTATGTISANGNATLATSGGTISVGANSSQGFIKLFSSSAGNLGTIIQSAGTASSLNTLTLPISTGYLLFGNSSSTDGSSLTGVTVTGTNISAGTIPATALATYATAPIFVSPASDSTYTPTLNTAFCPFGTISTGALTPYTNGISVAASTTYVFEMILHTLSAEATTTTRNIQITIDGTASPTLQLFANCLSSSSATTVSQTANAIRILSPATATTVVSNSASVATVFRTIMVKGIIRTTSAGNIIPKITWNGAVPTSGGVTIYANSYMTLTPLAASSSQTNGTVS